MKTGNVQNDGAGGMYLACDAWSPWLWHAPENEYDNYVNVANAQMMRLDRMPTAVRKNIKHIDIRCPVNGCRLATVYFMPRPPTPEELEHDRKMSIRNEIGEIKNSEGKSVKMKNYSPGYYLYVGRTAGGTEVYDIVNYGFNNTPRDDARGCSCCRIVYWRAGCHHGTATLEGNYLLDMFMMSERVHNLYFTEEQAVAQLPENLRPFWGKNTFHPVAEAWHPKKPKSRNRQPARSGIVPRVN